ncbi:PDZ domain-containing protein, partial [bacterium]|nr:PDZ domain-containing protein [bacterium]
MGGRASDVWLFNLKDYSSRKITDWGGTDSVPMWHDGDVYYMSDAGSNHRLNIWVYEADAGESRRVTNHGDYDIKWPSIGPGPDGDGEIIYQLGSKLMLLDLETERSSAVRITIPGDRPRLRTRTWDASDYIDDGDISSTGKRVVMSARGDIWSLPAESGTPQNLTRTNGIAERSPVWSPDGKWIAYFSDATDIYELYIMQSDGKGETRKLTSKKLGFLTDPVWSPNTERIAFWDHSGTLYVHDIEGGWTHKVHKAQNYHPVGMSWSSDSNWIALADRAGSNMNSVVYLYDVENEDTHQVTSGAFNATWPVFDRDGTYLYYACEMDYSSPTHSDNGGHWAYDQTDRLLVVPLLAETESPFAPEIDVEEWDEDDADGDEDAEGEDGDDGDADGDGDDGDADGDGDDEDAEEEDEPIVIDLEGFEERSILLPVERGGFYNLAVNSSGQLLCMRRGGDTSIILVDIEDEDEMEQEVISGAYGFAMSGDGEKIGVWGEGGRIAVMDAAAGQDWDGTVPTGGMYVDIDPAVEWREVLRDCWRIYKYYFYATNMHGVDWDGVWDDYSELLPYCSTRGDLSYIIGEMIGELNVGHAYYMGGEDTEDTPDMSVGLLGCSYELENGAYRIARIYTGGKWDADSRGQLSQPGVDVEVGDYLLAVNGVPIDATKDPWAAFQGLAGMTITITVSEEPKVDDEAREVVVETLRGERQLKYRAWIERNRAYVEEQSDGRVGYVYVPDTGYRGQNELRRQFDGQRQRDALIVDERWNGGRYSPASIVQLVNLPVTHYWTNQYRKSPEWDLGYATPGPACMIINESAGSGGDSFPFLFKEMGAGKLIGTRTWGGLVGLSGNPGLIDGGHATVPTFAFFNKDGTWGIEGYGVAPDIEVVDDPALMVNGGDPQLDAGIKHMLDELIRNPIRHPDTPAWPDRSGMGIPESDQ